MTNDAPTPRYDPGALPGLPSGYRPWPALWALVVGFFMILVDSTIVSVATDAIWIDLTKGEDINGVVWVTSAYLLAYVVPLLLAGRLGDMFGPKRLYLVGLTVFTLSSLWCGLSGTIGMLIAARVVQGIGAALMTPQTMAVITRTFPPDRRGTAMALWGSVAGVAILVGPLAGGVLVDQLGWEWVFFVNVPVGVIAFVAAVILVPNLPTHKHRLDVLGIVLSAAGLFLLTFGVQEGQKKDWSASIWVMIIGGVVLLGIFVWSQTRVAEPLMPLSLFSDRNFSLANAAIACMGFSITGMAIPLMLFAQKSMGLTPTRSALLMIPLAVLSGALAAPAGNLADKVHPRLLTGFGFAANAIALVWLGFVMRDTTPVIGILAPIGLMGVGNAFIWGPLSATANRNLPLRRAGAGSGVYNMTRQVGAVIGSASVGVLMQHEIVEKLTAATGHTQQGAGGAMTTGALPALLRGPWAEAMGATVFLPAAALVVAFVVVQFFETPTHQRAASKGSADPAAVGQ